MKKNREEKSIARHVADALFVRGDWIGGSRGTSRIRNRHPP